MTGRQTVGLVTLYSHLLVYLCWQNMGLVAMKWEAEDGDGDGVIEHHVKNLSYSGILEEEDLCGIVISTVCKWHASVAAIRHLVSHNP